uniref:Uncharacterized protein n=1 Tax=Caenorhabditis japonica TaxID=281687 RepID=A0A8R1HR16_CAEJA
MTIIERNLIKHRWQSVLFQAFTKLDKEQYSERRRLIRWYIILEHYKESESYGWTLPLSPVPYKDKYGVWRTRRNIASAGGLNAQSTNPILIHREHKLAELLVVETH